MNQKTDLEKIKQVSKMLLRAVKIEPIIIDGVEYPLCTHPYTNSIVTIINNEIKDLREEQNLIAFYKLKDNIIDKAPNISFLYIMIDSPWKLTYFKYIKDYLSIEDYAFYLADAWVTEENPNMDINVSIKESISYFRKANKKYLMNKKDYNKPEELKVHRGVANGRVQNGLSWTTNLKKAKWFAQRFDNEQNKGYIQGLLVKKRRYFSLF